MMDIDETEADAITKAIDDGGGGARAMFDALVKAGRSGISREALGLATGLQHTTGSFRNNLGTMRGAGIMVDIDRGGRVRLADTLLEAL